MNTFLVVILIFSLLVALKCNYCILILVGGGGSNGRIYFFIKTGKSELRLTVLNCLRIFSLIVLNL